ncbi:MAG: response regulator, partial [Pseudomonadota bacterium]
MGVGENRDDLGSQLADELPFLRRYARALTGAQDSGDRYAVATLEAIVADPALIQGDAPVKVSLFRTFHGIWSSSGAPVTGQ